MRRAPFPFDPLLRAAAGACVWSRNWFVARPSLVRALPPSTLDFGPISPHTPLTPAEIAEIAELPAFMHPTLVEFWRPS